MIQIKKRRIIKLFKIQIAFLLFLLFAIYGCKRNAVIQKPEAIELSNSHLRDTIYLHTDSCIVPEDIYLYIDSIKIGYPFTDKAGKYGYYRLIFSSSEETRTLHIEKIQIIGDGIVKMETRFTIPSEKLGLDYDFPNIDLIGWKTPEIIIINVGDKIITFDITKMKAIDVR